jgi:hypothetical protein
MFYNLKIRNELIKILGECYMPTNPDCSTLTADIFDKGVRALGKTAKRRGLSVRDGAFFCIYHMLEEFSSFTAQEMLEYPEKTGREKINNLDAKDRLYKAIFAEYNDIPDWIK